MWKLKVVRKYMYKLGDGEIEREAEFEFEFADIDEAVVMIEAIRSNGVNGSYEFSLIYEEGEQK
jgi:hypothetical protein